MGPRVLVVEDDIDIRQVMLEALESQGYDVAEAPDGAVALRIAREGPPDLILLDLMMPRMDGWTFRREQMGDEALARIPVVVVSAVGPDRLASVDADAIMVKPFGIDALFETVARFTGGATRGAEPRATALL